MLNSILRLGFLNRLNGAEPGSIGLLQRIFLVTDGTLTDILEAAVEEPIELVKLAAESCALGEADEAIAAEAGAVVMDRRVLLRGATSGRNYVYAESRLVLERLPEKLREGLIASDKPMGRLWAECRLESWKELLEVKRGPMGALAEHFPEESAEELLMRRYRVIAGGRPILLITESFPAKYSGTS